MHRRLPIVSIQKVPFEQTRLGRSLVRVVLAFKNAPVAVGTFHLESYCEDRPVREHQLRQVTQYLRSWPVAIVCGDFNVCDDVGETQHIANLGWIDSCQFIIAVPDAFRC